MARKKRCLTKNCDAEAKFRGLCSKCYQAARRAIEKGADEEALIEANLILPGQNSRKAEWTAQAEKAGLI